MQRSRRGRVMLAVMLLLGSSCTPRRRQHDAATNGVQARNVILCIGDGMGDSEITMARNYHVGAAGRLAMDQFPFTAAYTTYAIQESEPHLPEYVVDSAASATAWATGKKTSNGRISTAPGDVILPTILELAQKHGMAT